MLQDNVEGYRREITSLQERNQKLTATTQKQEQIINTMTQNLRGANEKLAVAEVRLVPTPSWLVLLVTFDGTALCGLQYIFSE